MSKGNTCLKSWDCDPQAGTKVVGRIKRASSRWNQAWGSQRTSKGLPWGPAGLPPTSARNARNGMASLRASWRSDPHWLAMRPELRVKTQTRLPPNPALELRDIKIQAPGSWIPRWRALGPPVWHQPHPLAQPALPTRGWALWDPTMPCHARLKAQLHHH